MEGSKRQLMRRIQIYDFAITEAVLYLDGHPNCRQALAYLDKHKQLRNAAAAEYEKRFGPLTVTGSDDMDTWRWVADAWPWEGEN